uniref:Uncharacterized protein n=1 Tax=Ditylenchus dipsaci TaxID=166011 RepID=A0A915EBW2_9BILA
MSNLWKKSKLANIINELNCMWAELDAMELVEEGLDGYSVKSSIVSKANAEEAEALSDTEVVEDEEERVPPATKGEATTALKVFRRYVNENTGDPAVFHLTDVLDDFLAQER